MKQPQTSPPQAGLKKSFAPTVTGAAIGLVIISAFVFSVSQPKPEWGSMWMIKPLILTPLLAALGGFLFYLVDRLFLRNGWSKFFALVLGVLVFIVMLWLGTVLGLNGTLWN